MKPAYGVSLSLQVRKSQDRRDLVSYQQWVADTRYFSRDTDRLPNGEFPRTVRLARPMSEEAANQLATELKKSFSSEFWDKGAAPQSVEVINIVTDDGEFLPASLEELRSSVEPPGITSLKSAVEFCVKSGIPPSEVLEIVKSETSGVARLREAVQMCLADKRLQGENILATVNHAVGGNR